MKKMKRFLSMLLVSTMVMSLLSGCGSKKKDETVTLTVYSQTANYSGEMTGWFAQVLKEKFNVKINVIPDTDGVYDTRMEAGDLGDIVIWGGDGEEYLQAASNGLLYDWNEEDLVTEYGPYIAENMSFALEKNMKLNGGPLYGFGHNVATSSEDHEAFFYTWDLRWDLYKELGYPTIKDLDGFIDVLADMKELCPTDDAGNPTYAVSLFPDWDGTMVMAVKATATAYYGYDELGVGLYDAEIGDFYPAIEEGGPYLDALKFYNKLYQRGLLDPDSMTQTSTEMAAKVQNGGTFFSIFDFTGSTEYNTDAHIAENKMMLPYAPDEAIPIAYGMNVEGGNRIWSIGSKTQYPELCMEILNWLSTPEGTMTSFYGPQGVTWDYDDEGNTYATELGILTHNDKNAEMTGDYSGKYADGNNQVNNTTWSINAENPMSNGETYNWVNWKSNQIDPKNDTEADWREYTGASDVQDYMNAREFKLAVATSYTESTKSDELKVVWEQVIKCLTDYSWKAIYAETDEEYDAIVAEMIENANAYGFDKCLEWSLGEAAIKNDLRDALK